MRLVFKDYPLAIHSLARPAHEAARCAGTFGRYWEYHDRLFEAQPRFSRSDLVRYAREVGLPVERFEQCLDEGGARTLVEADIKEGRRLGIKGTPTFFINGIRVEGAAPYETFKQVVDKVLGRPKGADR